MAEGTRNWKFVIWKESAPDDFERRLKGSFMRCCYILHDKDFHDDMITPEKPHYDGVIMLDGPVGYSKMLERMKNIADNGINTIQEAIQTSGALDYIIHLNETDPWKYHYDPKDVISINGADYIRDRIKYQDIEKYDDEIISFIEKNNITQYRTLVMIAQKDYPNWKKSIKGRTLFWKGYLTSKEDTQAHNVVTKFDNDLKEYYGIDY